METLAQLAADVNTSNSTGATDWVFAAMGGHGTTVNALVRLGANVYIYTADEDGKMARGHADVHTDCREALRTAEKLAPPHQVRLVLSAICGILQASWPSRDRVEVIIRSSPSTKNDESAKEKVGV